MKMMIIFLIVIYVVRGSFDIVLDDNVPKEVLFSISKATDVLSKHLILKKTIIIKVQWTPLNNMVVALSERPSFCSNDNFLAYPSSLSKQLFDIDCSDGIDIILYLNSNYAYVHYYGFENRPIYFFEYDLTSVLLHEILHGLGFYSGFYYDNEKLSYRLPDGFLTIYDWILFRNKEIDGIPQYDGQYFAVDNITNNDFLKNDNLTFISSSKQFSVSMYVPFNFQEGQSIGHRKDDFVLMSYYLLRGIHMDVMDIYVLTMLKEMGYSVKNCDLPNIRQYCGYCDSLEPCTYYNYYELLFLNLLLYSFDLILSFL